MEKLIQRLTDWLIERDLKRRHIKIDKCLPEERQQFIRVLNTLRRNKIMVVTREDGIYIRMAGQIEKDESFSLEWGKVISF